MDKAKSLFDIGLCQRCVGRFFSGWGHGMDNVERGKRLGEMLEKEGYESVERKFCDLCGDVFLNMEEKARWVMDSLKEIEFNSFLVGSRFEKEVLEREEEIRKSLGLSGETIKVEFNRELGKILEKMSGKNFSRDRPDIEILYDTRYDAINIQINPVYVYGRYRKLVRGIPQTRWPCRCCHGKGCERCDFTGKMYSESVEELIAHEFMLELRGKEHAFHGMGREDIDVRMLGNGRPFILEIKEPKKRGFDPKKMEKRVNEFAKGKVEVHDLRISSKEEVRRLKASKSEKTYMVSVLFESIIPEEKLKKALRILEGEIEQRTPRRVAHRRADTIRKRRVLSIRLVEMDGQRAKIEVRGEAGLYIKELMHGDEGRTHPSLSEVLDVPCIVEGLDVMEIHAKEE